MTDDLMQICFIIIRKKSNLIGRPEFYSLYESEQKTLKVGIHSLSACRSSFNRVSVEIGRQVRLSCPWARHLTELPLPLSS